MLKNPPPLVPSCLIAICEATGPCARDCVPPTTVWAVVKWPMFWMTPCETSSRVPITDSGTSTYRIVRTRSCQKLPRPEPLREMIPRIIAISTQIPTAAETKFSTVNPIIWLKYVSVVSPP